MLIQQLCSPSTNQGHVITPIFSSNNEITQIMIFGVYKFNLTLLYHYQTVGFFMPYYKDYIETTLINNYIYFFDFFK